MALDELSMAPAIQDIPTWIRGYKRLLEDINKVSGDTLLMIEGCSDIYGNFVDLGLISTFFYWNTAYPELFRYTFPDHLLVDMLYPTKQTMRPVFVSNISNDLIGRSFILGVYPWIYDLEGDDSLEENIGFKKRLREYLTVRRSGLNFFYNGLFLDGKGIITEKSIFSKVFKLSESYMLAIWNRDHKKGTLEFNMIEPHFDARIVNANSSERYRSNSKEIPIPKEEFSLIFIEKR
jgi:hypothetical protein